MSDAVYTNVREFNKTLEHWAKDVLPQEFEIVIRKLGLEALTSIVRSTPVKTGRARGNWQLTIDFPAEDEIERMDKNGQATINSGLRRLSELKGRGFGGIIFITNNVSYIIELEEGSSQQSPQGMVAVTFEHLNSIFG